MNKFLTLAATSLAALQMQVVAQETRPNIIYIMSDDHALQAISAYGATSLAVALPISCINLRLKLDDIASCDGNTVAPFKRQ